ncbi:MAG: hypothetical protein HOO06_16345 [Bdellovibrionaceae bacterium]|jgi:hypothetical protein|nr:hypothetical protein [Pseudobdellovibrionaceae bacterium]
MKLLISIIVLFFTITGFSAPMTITCSFGEKNTDGEGTFSLVTEGNGYYSSKLLLHAEGRSFGTSRIISVFSENAKNLVFSGSPLSVKLIEINKHTGESVLQGVFGAYHLYPNGNIIAFCE